MNCEIRFDAERGVVALKGDLDVYSVPELRRYLLERLQDGDELEVDLAEVSDIDTAGLQLMLLAKRVPGKTVRFSHHSPAVLRLIDLANVGQALGDPLLIPAGSEEK